MKDLIKLGIKIKEILCSRAKIWKKILILRIRKLIIQDCKIGILVRRRMMEIVIIRYKIIRIYNKK